MPISSFTGRRQYTPFRRAPQRVPGIGPSPCRLMLIGERPGIEESTSRPPQPFVGPSGEVLNTYLQAANIDRGSIYLTNCVKDFAAYSKPTATELERDKPELISEILSCDPDVIALVGAYAVTHVLGWDKADMDRRHGVPIQVNDLFQGELTRPGGWIVFPAYHPANSLHSPEMAPTVLDDYLRLAQVLDGELPPIGNEIPDEDCERRLITSSCELLDALGASRLVSIDTENRSDGKTWSVQPSVRPGAGYMLRCEDTPKSLGVLNTFRDWLRKIHPLVIMHNSLHDLPKMRLVGIDLVGMDIPFIDTMVLAYLLCVEPQSLKSLAYRHCGMDMQEYSEIIGDVGYGIAMEYLRQVASIEWPDPEPVILYEGNGARVKKPQNIGKTVNRIFKDIESGKILKDGSTTDPRDRWKKIDKGVKGSVIEVLGDMREPDLSDVPLEKAVSYGSTDADATIRIYPKLKTRIEAMDLQEVSKVDHDVLPMIDRMQQVGIGLAPVEFWDKLGDRCRAQMDKAKYEIYKLTGRDINPASGDQVAELLYGPKDKGGLGLTPLMLTDGGETGERRGSTNDKCLEDLLSASPVVEHVQAYREADKVRGTYVETLRELAATGDHRAHTTFKATRQHTGRITTAEPINLLSIPVRSELGEQCRYGFVASEGKVIYDSDMSQIEMRLMASESRDERLCKAFIDDRDIHSETAAEMFGVSVNGVEKFQRQAGKIVGFSIINLITPEGLVNQMILYRARRKDGSQWTRDDCDQMISTWFGIYPGVKRFHKECIEEARATGLTRESIAGRIRYLPNIWSNKNAIRNEAERIACSHKIQAGAAAILKKAMKRMWDNLRGVEGVEPLLPVHDETLWECDEDEGKMGLVETVVPWAFENSVKLRVPILAEGGWGPSWGAAKH